jgi:hypothetical protein
VREAQTTHQGAAKALEGSIEKIWEKKTGNVYVLPRFGI